VECIHEDGTSDEGPSHEEVQFWWTANHLSKGRVVTFVTNRSSGSSYLNWVELQNGCLSLAHASTFIPSTLAGSCTNPESGVVDKLRENLDPAADANNYFQSSEFTEPLVATLQCTYTKVLRIVERIW